MQAEWLWGLAGGAMIGLAGAILLLFNGRVMGASGIVAGLVDRTDPAGTPERAAFLAGLVLVPGAVWHAAGGPPTALTADLALVATAGLLVGFGTRIAGGCTSGHGVCGISRLSPRGITATICYMLAAAVTVALARHVLAGV